MPKFDVVKGTRNGREAFTFLIDGHPTMRWFPTEHAVNRCIERLKLGRSAAFGGPTVVSGGAVVGQLKTSDAIRAQVQRAEPLRTEVIVKGVKKVRETPQFHALLDGELLGAFSTETDARCAAACEAMKSGGKLRHIAKAEEGLRKRNPGKVCKVYACPTRHRIVATVDGAEVSVGITPDGDVTVKG